MKEGWEIRKLGEVCDFFKEQGNYTGLPYVGMEDISQFSNCFLGSVEPKAVASSTFRFNKGQVLYGRLRPYLKKIMLADFAGHCSTEIFPIQTIPTVTIKMPSSQQTVTKTLFLTDEQRSIQPLFDLKNYFR